VELIRRRVGEKRYWVDIKFGYQNIKKKKKKKKGEREKRKGKGE
jgi:hypothetical protein